MSLETTGVVQINHIIAVSRPFFDQRQDDVRKIMHGTAAARHQLGKDEQRMLPVGQNKMRKSVETLVRSLVRQGIITRGYQFQEIFDDIIGLCENPSP